MHSLVPLVDLWLYNYKETDPRLHEQYVGKPQALILENLQRLHDGGAKILLRCPLVPELTAPREHLDGIVAVWPGGCRGSRASNFCPTMICGEPS